MLDHLILLLITAVVTFALYPLWINFVYKYHMGEQIRSDGPATHLVKKGTPTMGGVVFLFTAALITLLFNQSRNQTLFPIFVAAMSGLFGIIEDFHKVYKRSNLNQMSFLPSFKSDSFIFIPIKALFKLINFPWKMFKEAMRIVGSSEGRGLQSYQKLLIQLSIGGFVAYWTYFKLGWDYIWLPLIGNINVGWLYPIFILIVFLIVLNFVAFSDGVDGLVGGLSLISFGAFWVVSSYLEYNLLAGLCATFVGALLPYIYFNIHPARIFMGNVGSHVLGAVMAVIAVVLHREIALLFICFVFLVDGASSPLQSITYKFTRKRLFRMAPIHHHFELLGWPESKVTMRFWLAGIFFAFIGIFISLL